LLQERGVRVPLGLDFAERADD